MSNDLVFIDECLIDSCDMSEFIIGHKTEHKKINGKERLVINVKVKDLKKNLNDRGIIEETLVYNLREYTNSVCNATYIDENYALRIKEFFQENDDINKWKKCTKELILNKTKPDDTWLLITDYEYEEKLFSEDFVGDKLHEYILKKEISICDEINVSKELYNIPFLTKNEYLLFVLSLFDETEIVTIDITERNLCMIDELRTKVMIHRYTSTFYKFENNYKYLKNNLSNYLDDKLVCNLFITYSISLFESYLKGVLILAVNNSMYFLRQVVECDNRFYNKKGKIKCNELFFTLEKLKSEVSTFIQEESFQSEETFTTYITKVFKVYEESDDEYIQMKEKYFKYLNKRHDIVHYNDISKEFKVEEFKQYLEMIYQLNKKIDFIVLKKINL